MADNRLRVGIIGAGEVAQVIHLPALAMLSHLYVTTAVCDISRKVRYGNTCTYQIVNADFLRTSTTALPSSTSHSPPQTPRISSPVMMLTLSSTSHPMSSTSPT